MCCTVHSSIESRQLTFLLALERRRSAILQGFFVHPSRLAEASQEERVSISTEEAAQFTV
jgi:hypothetical protein